MASESAPRSMFFAGMSLAILAVVLVGFGPTFYLRPLFPNFPRSQPETWIVFVHGGFMTAWFVILATQTLLVANGRVALHRRLGVVGILIAAITVVLNLIVTFKFGARLAAADNLVLAPSIVWGNLAGLLVFVPCVVLAAYHRRRPELHKRLMIIAAISVTSQALTRFWWSFPILERLYLDRTGVIAFLVALAAYDFRQRGRIERATLIGGISLMVLLFASTEIASTEFGVGFIRSLA